MISLTRASWRYAVISSPSGTNASARSARHLCEPGQMEHEEMTRDELEELVRNLREEVARLKEEIRRIRRDQHEVPPHYL